MESQWKGFCKAKPIRHKRLASRAKQIKSTTKHWLCEAQLIRHNGFSLRSEANAQRWIGFSKQNQSLAKDWLAKPSRWKGFVKQSQSAKKYCLCEAMKIHLDGKALRGKVNPSQRIGFAKQSQSTFQHDGNALLRKANPSKQIGLRSKANPPRWIVFVKHS